MSICATSFRLVAAYAKDPWFYVPANTKDLHKDLGLWYMNNKVVVPDADGIRQQLLQELHDIPYDRHLGVAKTINLVYGMY